MSINLVNRNGGEDYGLAAVNVLIYNMVDGKTEFRIAPWPYTVLPRADEKLYFPGTSPLLVESLSWRKNGIVIHAQHISYITNNRLGNPEVKFTDKSPFVPISEEELVSKYDA